MTYVGVIAGTKRQFQGYIKALSRSQPGLGVWAHEEFLCGNRRYFYVSSIQSLKGRHPLELVLYGEWEYRDDVADIQKAFPEAFRWRGKGRS